MSFSDLHPLFLYFFISISHSLIFKFDLCNLPDLRIFYLQSCTFYLEYFIYNFCNILEKFQFTTSKTVLKIKYKNIVYELPHEMPQDAKLRKLGNKEILGKDQNWMEREPSFQSSFKK